MKIIIHVLLFLLLFFFITCAGQNRKIIFYPDGITDNNQEISDPFESWHIIESQNGPGDAEIPEWARSWFRGDVREIESRDEFFGKYVFIGENRGSNFFSLQQWANSFNVAQDLPRLVAQRVERRLISTASLYPDDEYGEYFEVFMKRVSDEEISGAVKEQVFWLKRKIIYNEEDNENAEQYFMAETERYEFLTLVSIDKGVLQEQILNIMLGIKTRVPPTNDQDAAINRINNTFFMGF
jgi:hypothetical protein